VRPARPSCQPPGAVACVLGAVWRRSARPSRQRKSLPPPSARRARAADSTRPDGHHDPSSFDQAGTGHDSRGTAGARDPGQDGHKRSIEPQVSGHVTPSAILDVEGITIEATAAPPPAAWRRGQWFRTASPRQETSTVRPAPSPWPQSHRAAAVTGGSAADAYVFSGWTIGERASTAHVIGSWVLSSCCCQNSVMSQQSISSTFWLP
jgi:hypothetical protein